MTGTRQMSLASAKQPHMPPPLPHTHTDTPQRYLVHTHGRMCRSGHQDWPHCWCRTCSSSALTHVTISPPNMCLPVMLVVYDTCRMCGTTYITYGTCPVTKLTSLASSDCVRYSCANQFHPKRCCVSISHSKECGGLMASTCCDSYYSLTARA